MPVFALPVRERPSMCIALLMVPFGNHWRKVSLEIALSHFNFTFPIHLSRPLLDIA
jgi:hypothetical protein